MEVPLVLLNRLARIIYAFLSDGDRCSNNLLNVSSLSSKKYKDCSWTFD